MENKNISKFADILYDSERSRQSIPPLTGVDATLTAADAYAIQLENVRRVTAMGQVISGKKIGLTSAGIQQQLGVNEPDYGHLFASMECADGTVDTTQLLQPKIEGELAFVLKADLTGGKVTAEDVRSATDYVVAAFEIVDSRVVDWKIKLPDTIADNASSGRYILGTTRLPLQRENLAEISMKLYKNQQLLAESSGAAVLGDPCLAVAWLANRLWDYGVSLKKGEVILSGAFSAAPEAQKGDVFTAEFSTLGTVTARFV